MLSMDKPQKKTNYTHFENIEDSNMYARSVEKDLQNLFNYTEGLPKTFVSKLIAGTGISLSPVAGTNNVTVTATGIGTLNHASLNNLSYATAGHTGFQPAGSYLTTSSAATTYLALNGSNSDDTTDGFDWFKNLVVGAGNAGKGHFIYRNADYIYTLINAAPTATTYSTVDYQIVTNGYLDLQSYDSGATNDIRLFRFKEIADGVDGNYLRIRRHTTNVHTGGELDLYLDQYGVSYITTTVVGDYGGQLNLWAGGNKGMEIGNYIAGYLGYNLKILQYGGTDVALLGATSGNENVSIGGYLTATGNTKHFYFNLSDTDDMIHISRESTDILGIKIDMPTLLTSVKSGATQAAASAVANEIWKTSGHATLPDNVLMVGV